MASDNTLRLIWEQTQPAPGVNLYALVDPAMDAAAATRLARHSLDRISLLAGGSAPDQASPQLLNLGPADHLVEAAIQGLEASHSSAAFTLIFSRSDLKALAKHLGAFVDVLLPGDQSLLLALWDPAILGTLVGQADDDTLHVPGPVLQPDQLSALLAPMTCWWYCDREAHWHCVKAEAAADTPGSTLNAGPLILNQSQEDALVEASVPDQILFHLRQNRPTLLDDPALPKANYHRFVRQVLKGARQLGLEGMRDLVNFVALCLIYRQRMESDPQILHLLDQVQSKRLTMDEAMKRMPE